MNEILDFDKIFDDSSKLTNSNDKICMYCNASTEFCKIDGKIICKFCNTIVSEELIDVYNDNHCIKVDDLNYDTSIKVKIVSKGKKGIKRVNSSTVNRYIEQKLEETKKFLKDIIERYEMWQFVKTNKIIESNYFEKMPNREYLVEVINKSGLKYIENIAAWDAIIHKSLTNYAALLRPPRVSVREPRRTAVISICFYYACKERYILFTISELCFIFGITSKIYTSANNKINRNIKEKVELKSIYNRHPPNIEDSILILNHHYKLTESQIFEIKRIANRIENITMIAENDAQVIVGAIVNCCLKSLSSFVNTKLNENDLAKYLDISYTSLKKMTKKIMPYVYDVKQLII